ncbi:MAG: acetylxylan esterase [Pirellulaceae bacterium]
MINATSGLLALSSLGLRHSLAPLLLIGLMFGSILAETPRALPAGEKPADARLGPLRNVDGYFPFQQVDSKEQWEQRADEVRRRVHVATGLWPELPRTPLNAVIHGKVERDDFMVERVYFESLPGHFVTGSLYRPKGEPPEGGWPVVLSPHGHAGRFQEYSPQQLKQEIAIGAERFEPSGRNPRQSRCVQLARMGCVTFMYDMIGYSDSVQMEHRPGVRPEMNTAENFGFFSPQADLRQINMMGLQTWNSIRALDFLLSLENVDTSRVGVSGASGGGTQTYMICAVDPRPTVGVPAVMVSTSMQGGCTCENAPHLRIGAGNIDFAALMAPKPQALISANDWTVEIDTKGMPDLKKIYAMLGAENNLNGKAFLHFQHNYNAVSRTYMYNFMNQHLKLGLPSPVIERDYEPLNVSEVTVWTDEHPKPSGAQVGDDHERALIAWWDEQMQATLSELTPTDSETLGKYREVIGGAWKTMIGRTLEDVGEVSVETIQRDERDDHVMTVGLVRHIDKEEQLPILVFNPSGEQYNGQLVILLHEQGKAGLLNDDGQPIEAVRKLLGKGYAVLGVDLIGQGEFTEDGTPVENTRTIPYGRGDQPWQKSAAYTFGYNPALFAQRTHDVLTLIEAACLPKYETREVHLLAMGQTVGPIALAAGAMSDERLHSVAADTAGFQFVQVDRIDHPMFIPGAVRYGDVAALLALNAPRAVWTSDKIDPQVANAVYTAADAKTAVQSQSTDDATAAAIEWLLKRTKGNAE